MFFRNLILVMMLLPGSLTAMAQRYSKLIPDSTIHQFMKWYFSNQDTGQVNRTVSLDIRKYNADDFTLADSSLLRTDVRYITNIFNTRNRVNGYLKSEDGDYFLQQINKQREARWTFKWKGIRWMSPDAEGVSYHPGYTLFSYSLPIFTYDHQYVIMIKSFYCGLVCGGGEYMLFENTGPGQWRKITTYSRWDE